MFKTARFKIHNPSRHKRAMLSFALKQYHLTLADLLEKTLAKPDLVTLISQLDNKGRSRINKFALSKLLYTIAPKEKDGWPIAPLRDYLIGEAAAMLLSHFKKQEKGKNDSNPPTMPSLLPMSEESYRQAYSAFCSVDPPEVKPQHGVKIQKARDEGQTRVAARLERIYQGYATTKAAAQLLRQIDGALPHPLEFTRPEVMRGFCLARKGNDIFLLLRLFSRNHRYSEAKVLEDGFTDCRTGEDLSGKKFNGVILPLECGRAFHEDEYLKYGKAQSAKLIEKRNAAGVGEFYAHIAFKFTPEHITPVTVLGLDRGAAKIGAATVITEAGNRVGSSITLDGAAFSAEMARLRALIADRQQRGLRTGRAFKLRGRRSEIIVGEYANLVIQAAVQHRAQIVIEKINARAMNLFLTQSQFTKLKQLLDYKAERAGLPKSIEVPAAYTSQTCARCAHQDRANRPKKDAAGRSIQDVFLCTLCGHQANADENASEIIALRGLHQQLKGGKFQKFPAFQQWMRDMGRDGFGAQAPTQ